MVPHWRCILSSPVHVDPVNQSLVGNQTYPGLIFLWDGFIFLWHSLLLLWTFQDIFHWGFVSYKVLVFTSSCDLKRAMFHGSLESSLYCSLNLIIFPVSLDFGNPTKWECFCGKYAGNWALDRVLHACPGVHWLNFLVLKVNRWTEFDLYFFFGVSCPGTFSLLITMFPVGNVGEHCVCNGALEGFEGDSTNCRGLY
jgi:hypothetical protein